MFQICIFPYIRFLNYLTSTCHGKATILSLLPYVVTPRNLHNHVFYSANVGRLAHCRPWPFGFLRFRGAIVLLKIIFNATIFPIQQALHLCHIMEPQIIRACFRHRT